ncbi:MAG: hypothetical protein V2I33_22295 [Kangiellaceae bacterium]|jgi:hypothetical protein|nr:hypothetical protein [Kangiellaceae bacterium]
MLMVSFQLNWPTYVFDFLSYQETTGSVLGQLYSMDCMIEKTSSVEPFYQKVAGMASLPFIIMIASLIVWGVVSWAKRSIRYIAQHCVSTIIVVMFLFHPVVLRTLFSCFACVEIESGEYWLEDEQNIKCWDEEHMFFAIYIAVPGLIAWGLIFPIVILSFLLARRRRLEDADTKIKFGFLLHGFRPERYYWEFIILYRKVIMAFIVVFLSNVSVTL